MFTNPIVKKVLEHGTAIVIFLLVSLFYFYPQLQGKVVQQTDIVQFKSMSNEITTFMEETGEETQWTNAMFGGMPAYQIHAPQRKNLMRLVEDVFQLFFERPIGYFIALMICFYIMMTSLGVSRWLSVIGAIACALGTNNLVLFEAGHTSKIRAITYGMPVIAGVILAYRDQLLKGGVLFTLGMGLSLFANHIQMTYLLGILLLIFVIVKAVKAVQSQELPSFAKASGVLLLGLLLAVGSSTSKLWTTYSYGKDTMRGQPILKKAEGPTTSSSEVDGLEFGYAMQWSNGTVDLFAAFIPGVAGGGSSELVSEGAPIYKDSQWGGVVRQGLGGRIPLYWGSLPFTSGPIYFGAIICFLFVLGLILVKGPMKWWLAGSVLLLFLLSMGKNFETFNRIIFDYLPLYNKFRTPNSILSLVAILMPFLGIMGLSKIVTGEAKKEEVMRALQIALGSLGAVGLFFAFMGPSFFDFAAQGDAGFLQRIQRAVPQLNLQNIDPIIETRKSLMRSDALRSLLLIAVAGGLIWAYIQEKIKATHLLIALGLVTIFDLWTVGRRYLDESNFVQDRNYEANFQPRPVDELILKDDDPNFRVLDLSINTFNSAFPSYFHKTIGGYHPAKLQRYQDVIERHISRNNIEVLNMLNTRYIITQEQELRPNTSAYGNAWFVDNIKIVPDANAEIDGLNGINGEQDVIVHQEYNDYVSGFTPQKNGSIELTEYAPNRLVYSSNSTSEQFAVFSEVWYGPNKGWQAYIDGEPVEHIRANYVLRAMRVPAGQHTIEFKFAPKAYYAGENISLVTSLLILLGILAYLFLEYKKLADLPPEPVVKKVSQAKPEKKSAPSKRKKKRK